MMVDHCQCHPGSARSSGTRQKTLCPFSYQLTHSGFHSGWHPPLPHHSLSPSLQVHFITT
eukprot:574774-Rhodomonas_salina.1